MNKVLLLNGPNGQKGIPMEHFLSIESTSFLTLLWLVQALPGQASLGLLTQAGGRGCTYICFSVASQHGVTHWLSYQQVANHSALIPAALLSDSVHSSYLIKIHFPRAETVTDLS